MTTTDEQRRSYFATFGSGHSGFPGYMEIIAVDRAQAERAMFHAFGARWAFMYETRDGMHAADRIKRGTIHAVEHFNVETIA